MFQYFALILTVLVIVSGGIYLLDMFFLKKTRLAKGYQETPVFIEYARDYFPVLLIVLVIRSFIVQPFHVPTGSLEPTILPSELLVVNQFIYGLRLPVLNTKF